MKYRVKPSKQEHVLKKDEFIVSKTNPKGLITYCNPVFMDFAQMQEVELLGKQHNIIRHPDMPRSVFRYAWQTIQSGQEFNGYVKNMSADGGYYWTFANITPSFDQSCKCIGYFSVRRKPSTMGLHFFEPLYRKMVELEKNTPAAQAMDASWPILENALLESGKSYDEQIFALQFG